MPDTALITFTLTSPTVSSPDPSAAAEGSGDETKAHVGRFHDSYYVSQDYNRHQLNCTQPSLVGNGNAASIAAGSHYCCPISIPSFMSSTEP